MDIIQNEKLISENKDYTEKFLNNLEQSNIVELLRFIHQNKV